MAEWKGILLSLPAVAVMLGALTLGLVYVGRYYALGVVTLFLLAAPIILAVVYLWWYSTLPYEPRPARLRRTPSTVPEPATEEPFEDPVMEADEADRTARAEPPAEAPAIVDDDAPADAPPEP